MKNIYRYRGVCGRRIAKHRKEWLLEKQKIAAEKLIIQTKYATKIQTYWRSRHARKVYLERLKQIAIRREKRLKATYFIQRVYRGYLGRKIYRELNRYKMYKVNASNKIKLHYHNYLLRREMKDRVIVRQQIIEREKMKRLRIENDSATMINSVVRGFLARCIYKKLKREHEENKAATKIQSAIRRKLCMIYKEKLKESYILIQKNCRYFLDNLHLRKRFLDRRELLDRVDAERRRLEDIEKRKQSRIKKLKKVYFI